MPLLSPRWWQYFFGFIPSALPYSRATVCTSFTRRGRFTTCGDLTLQRPTARCDHRALVLSRQRHPWSRASHSGFAPNQLSVWLPLDCQQSRAASSAPPRSGESGGPSSNEFFGNVSLLCRSSFGGACHSTSQLTHSLGRTPVFLGTARIFTRCGGRIWSAAFGPFLEHRADRHCAFSHRALTVTGLQFRLTNR